MILSMFGLLNIINRTNIPIDLLLQNIKGFNEKNQINKRAVQSFNMIRTIQMSNVMFDFYRKGKLLLRQDCSLKGF